MSKRITLAFWLIITTPIAQGMVEQELARPEVVINTLILDQFVVDKFVIEYTTALKEGISKLAVHFNGNQQEAYNEYIKKLDRTCNNKKSIKEIFVTKYIELRKNAYEKLHSRSAPSAFGIEQAELKECFQDFNLNKEAIDEWNMIIKKINPSAKCCVIL